jgi:anthranilate phosphoribosyltransferase
MGKRFRELIKKIGGGPQSSRDLTRDEAAIALELMTQGEATPAQIGAFLIAHRMKRPTPEELAGMLDAWEGLVTGIEPLTLPTRVMVMGSPYDGRARTAPITPMVALVLAAAGQPVLLHGGDVMPPKMGMPLEQVWQAMGIYWRHLGSDRLRSLLESTGVGFWYAPTHAPRMTTLIPYREQIGKRPPLATLELMASPYAGAQCVVAGFVHPPTETLIRGALALRQVEAFVMVKGLEGSVDIPCHRPAIVLHGAPHSHQRLTLAAKEYGLQGAELTLSPVATLPDLYRHDREFRRAILWNAGCYLWLGGVCDDVSAGLEQAEAVWGGAIALWERLQALTADRSTTP